MSIEDLEIENLNRYERVLADKHGELSAALIKNIDKMRQDLSINEIDVKLLTRISDVMYEATMIDDIKDVEVSVKNLVDTFWHQV